MYVKLFFAMLSNLKQTSHIQRTNVTFPNTIILSLELRRILLKIPQNNDICLKSVFNQSTFLFQELI